MAIQSIKFQKGIFGRRSVSVLLTSGNEYRIKTSGDKVFVIPVCQDSERETLKTVYRAVWEYLSGAPMGQALDRGAKIASGRLVTLLAWPADFTEDTEARLRYVINKISFHENIL